MEYPPQKFKAGDKVKTLSGTIVQIKAHSGARKIGDGPFINMYDCLKLTKKGLVDKRSSKRSWLSMRHQENELTKIE